MKVILSVLVFFISINLQAQNFKFGKVSKEELGEKIHSEDLFANAAVLFKREHIRFEFSDRTGFYQVRTIHERIKIYNKEGFDWATKKIRLYHKTNFVSDKLFKLRAYTYNLVDGEIQINKLKSGGKFKEEVNEFWNISSFTMPNIKEGSVIEYSYEINSPFWTIDDIDLQYTIPIDTLDVNVKTLDYFSYNKILNTQSLFIPNFKQSKSSRMLSTTETNAGGSGGWSLNRKNATSNFQQNLDENIISINEINIPALKGEKFISNLENYQSRLKMELTAVDLPGEPIRNYYNSWDAVTKTIYKLNSFGGQLDKLAFYKKDIDAITTNLDNPKEKIDVIYNYVKSKVKWNNKYGFSSNTGLKKAYGDGVGNVADINLMLVSMLRYVGVDANPVLVSTKSNGISIFPTKEGFNYVICHIEEQQIETLLDATDENSMLNILPIRDLNWKGRLVRSDGTSNWINLIPEKTSLDITSLNFKINSDLSVDGKARSQKFDYLAKDYRDRYSNSNEDSYIRVLEKDKGDLIISSLKVEGESELQEPIKITYDFSLSNLVEELGDKLYFSPLLFLRKEENPYKLEERIYPIDLTYPISSKYLINIMLPDGYEVESLPEKQLLDFLDNKGQFKYLVNQNDKFIQVNVELKMNTSSILPQNYTFFKQFFAQIIEKESEKIVLKKI